METLRSSRVTIDDQPMVSSVLRKDNEDLRSRVELQEKELAKSKHTKSMLEQQVSFSIMIFCILHFFRFRQNLFLGLLIQITILLIRYRGHTLEGLLVNTTPP